MFTGLIEEVGLLKSLSSNGNLTIQCSKIIPGTKIGDSISVNGVCLTVTDIKKNLLVFHISITTAKLSGFNPEEIVLNSEINLERALKLEDRLGGHIVSGHIDGRAKIINIEKKSEDYLFEFLYPKEFKQFIAPKGSITIDGISLTISNVLSSSFTVTIIPQTFKETNLKSKKIGDYVNFECDIIAKYLANIIKFKL